jgi:hypothetical protein
MLAALPDSMSRFLGVSDIMKSHLKSCDHVSDAAKA